MANPTFNKVLMIGRLTNDVDLRYTPNGIAVATMRIASNREFNTTEGKKEETCFVNIIAWDKLAEACAQYLKKSMLIFVEGRLQSRVWETQDKQKRSTLEIRAENIQFLEKSPKIETRYEEMN